MGGPRGSARSPPPPPAPSQSCPQPLGRGWGGGGGGPGGHVRCRRVRHKRQPAVGRAAKLSHPARGPPGARRAQLPP